MFDLNFRLPKYGNQPESDLNPSRPGPGEKKNLT